jgi:hypothetical protein
MSTPGSDSLFPQTPPEEAVVIDMVAKLAATRAANDAREALKRTYDPNARKDSEARIDQGWASERVDMTDIVSDEPPVVDLNAKKASMQRHPVSGDVPVADTETETTEGPRVITPYLRSIIDDARQKLKS